MERWPPGPNPSPSSSSKLGELLQLLLQKYFQHQLLLLSQLPDERLMFELGTLEVLGCTELYFKGVRGMYKSQLFDSIRGNPNCYRFCFTSITDYIGSDCNSNDKKRR
jgi:hypothetical protein